MTNMRRTQLFLLFIILISMVTEAKAQDTTETHPMRGFMPNMEQLSSPVDNIDIASGKLNLSIPLASLPRGKGGSGYNLNLEYDSHIYDTSYAPNPTYPAYTATLLNTTSTGGWRYNVNNVGIEAEYKSSINSNANCPNQYTDPNIVRYRVILSDGNMHLLYLRGYETLSDTDAYYGLDMATGRSNACGAAHGYPAQYTGMLTYYTVDGSYLKYEVSVDGVVTRRINPWVLRLIIPGYLQMQSV
jgi:hypothetical protein